MKSHQQQPLKGYSTDLSQAQRTKLAKEFLAVAKRRRTVRNYAPTEIPKETIDLCLQAAASAPSGANQQPWHFVAISDPGLKAEIRQAAEKEEQAFYEHRAPEQWLQALEPIGTDASKPFLETAPWLIAIFAQSHGVEAETSRSIKHYYVAESVGIATGILIAALNHCGLATLTHTPSPMRFLNDILERPKNERPFLLLVVGLPTEDCQVPKLEKKKPSEVITYF